MRHVCGLDVHKDSVFVCIINEDGIVFQAKFGVLTPDLEQLAETLQQYDVGEVCMESTSIYWMPVWRVLEPYVVNLKLVNPYFIKQLPGKKSDVKDAEWIATCLLKDLIKGSYVPEDRIQQLRQYDRRIFLFSPLGHPKLQIVLSMRSHSACCSSLIPNITLCDRFDFGDI